MALCLWKGSLVDLDENEMEEVQKSTFSQIDIAGTKEYLVLMYVLKAFLDNMKALDTLWPLLRAKSKANTVVENCIAHQIELFLVAIKQYMMELVREAHTAALQDLGKSTVIPLASEKLSKSLTNKVQQVLHQMDPFIQYCAIVLKDLAGSISNLVQMQMFSCLKWFNTELVRYTDPTLPVTSKLRMDPLEPISSGFLLLLAQVCCHFAENGIPECIHNLIECLPVNRSVHSNTLHEAKRNAVDITSIIHITESTGNELFHFVAKRYGTELCSIIYAQLVTSHFSWASHLEDEPRSVQDSIEQVVIGLFRIGKDISCILGERDCYFASNVASGFRLSNYDTRHQRIEPLRSLHALDSTSIHDNVKRILEKRIQVYPTHSIRQISTEWMLQFVSKMVIKALSEWTRASTLSVHGFQQIQVDAEFLASVLPVLIEQQEEVKVLLSELLSSAQYASKEETLLEHSSVVAIVSARATIVIARSKG